MVTPCHTPVPAINQVNVTVCSAAEAPHPEAEALKAFFPVVQKQHHFYRDVFEKEKQDYVFCLKHASCWMKCDGLEIKLVRGVYCLTMAI
jgi:hypothetical protein